LDVACVTGELDPDILKALRSFESSGNTRPLTQSSLPEERKLKTLEVPQKYPLLVVPFSSIKVNLFSEHPVQRMLMLWRCNIPIGKKNCARCHMWLWA